MAAKTVGIDYSTSDARKIAGQTRQTVDQNGQALNSQAAQQAAADNAAATGTQDYLGNIASPLAEGNGGYNSSELSQITMTPEQQQQLVTSAGISAGTGTAAGVGAAQRAAAAAGGSPAAVAAYRARAAQQQGSLAGDAMTKARTAASDEAASRAENVGQARIGQQTTGLNYYSGLQSQQNANAQGDLNRQAQIYGTQTSGLTGAANTGVTASQTPSTFDKVMGGVSGALSFLDMGDVIGGSTPAVIGENGPEKVVQVGAPSLANAPHSADYLSMTGGGAPAANPTTVNPDGSLTFAPGANAPSMPQKPGLMSKLKGLMKPSGQGQQPPPLQSGSGIQALGQVAGKALSFLGDGDIATQGDNGIFTKPTRVNLSPGEAVVPLSYRAGAKTRPSMASLPAARQSYGGY